MMAAQGALCHPLLPSACYSPCQAFKSSPSRARAFFNGGACPLSTNLYKQQMRSRSDSIVRNGLFDFLKGGPSGASDELVSEILEAARSTNGGSKASMQTKEQIEELVRMKRMILNRT